MYIRKLRSVTVKILFAVKATTQIHLIKIFGTGSIACLRS
jgi:hypothetical protein